MEASANSESLQGSAEAGAISAPSPLALQPFPPQSTDPPSSSSTSSSSSAHSATQSLPLSSASLTSLAASASRPPPLAQPADRPQCPHCSRQFKDKYNLKRHLRKHDSNVERFLCPHCQCSFPVSNNRKRHERACGKRELQRKEVERLQSGLSWPLWVQGRAGDDSDNEAEWAESSTELAERASPLLMNRWLLRATYEDKG